MKWSLFTFLVVESKLLPGSVYLNLFHVNILLLNTFLKIILSFLSSFNCMDWHLLPHATEALIAEVDVAAKGRFIGDPSYTYEHTEIRHRGEGDDAVEEEVMVSQRNTFGHLVDSSFSR